MKRALIGSGGHAMEVMSQMGEILPCFVDDEFMNEQTKNITELNFNEYEVMIAISNPKVRANIVDRLPSNTKFFTYIHPTSLILNNVKIGVGSFIGAYSILTTDIELGTHSILNRANHIGHDTIIGNFLSMMPGSIISGNCNIGSKVYLGTNASVKEKTVIVDDVTIGLNSGVVKDINESGIYVGTPTYKLK
jgi:sugar O-acyltransferase (sialic acid O-acetyltransferase NeuD family)